MIVGAAVIELRVHGSRSLKARRGVVRSISARVRSRFNVSVSEVGGQDTWQRVVLGLSMTGSQAVPLRRALEKAVAFVEQTHLAEVVASEIELIPLPLVGEDAFADDPSDPEAGPDEDDDVDDDEVDEEGDDAGDDDLPWERESRGAAGEDPPREGE